MSEEYDYESYEKSLKLTIDLSEKDYWNQYTNINAYQVSVAKTYLWISAALLGAFVTAYDRYSDSILNSNFTLFFALLSILTVVVAFGVCIYAIPARKGYQAIPEVSWGEFPALSYKYLCEKKANSHVYVLSQIADRIDAATLHNIQTNQDRAKLLRITSWVLIASFSFSVVTAITASLDSYIQLHSTQIVEVSMTDQEPTNTQTPLQSTNAPDVPKPAGAITVQSTQQITGQTLHTNQRFTDSVDTKEKSSK